MGGRNNDNKVRKSSKGKSTSTGGKRKNQKKKEQGSNTNGDCISEGWEEFLYNMDEDGMCYE